MRGEISRKDELIKRHSDKLAEWQTQLLALQTRSGTMPSVGSRPLSTSGPGSHHLGIMSGTGATANPQVAMPGLSPVGASLSAGSMGHTGPNMSHGMNSTMGMAMGQSTVMGQVSGPIQVFFHFFYFVFFTQLLFKFYSCQISQ